MNKQFKNIIVMVVLVLSLISCMPNSSVALQSSTGLPVSEDWLTAYGGLVVDMSSGISPDGEWIAFIDNANGEKKLRVQSTENPNINFVSQSFSSKEEYIFSWSPNSKTIAISSAMRDDTKCPYNKVLLFSLDTQNETINTHEFIPDQHNEKGNCFQIQWGPESDRLLVNNFTDKFYIIDLDGQNQLTFSLDLGLNEIEDGFYWQKSGLYYVEVNNSAPSNVITKLKKILLTKPITYELITTLPPQIHILGWNANSTEIVFDSDIDSERTKFEVINLETNEQHTIGEVIGYLYNSSDSINSHYSAFVIEQNPNSGKQLWVLDWEKHELNKTGSAIQIIGWREKEKGFEVISGDNKSGYYRKIIVP